MTTNEKRGKIDKKPLFISFSIVMLMVLSHLFFRNSDFYVRLGIYPKDVKYLHGIVTSPFVHGSWGHLGNNIFSLFILTYLTVANYPKVHLKILGYGTLMTGAYVWLFARPSFHIGASGVVYMLSGFVIMSAILRRDRRSVAMAFIIVLINGSFMWGVVPTDWLEEWLGLDQMERNISWESHLYGLISGVILGVYFKKNGPKPFKKDWAQYDPQLEALTQVYEEYMEKVNGSEESTEAKENHSNNKNISSAKPLNSNQSDPSKTGLNKELAKNEEAESQYKSNASLVKYVYISKESGKNESL